MKDGASEMENVADVGMTESRGKIGMEEEKVRVGTAGMESTPVQHSYDTQITV